MLMILFKTFYSILLTVLTFGELFLVYFLSIGLVCFFPDFSDKEFWSSSESKWEDNESFEM